MSTKGISKELELVLAQRLKIERLNKRIIVAAARDERMYALGMSRASAMREGPRLQTATDFLPVFTIAGMPPEMYPKYVTYLVGWTLAAAAVENPWMAGAVWTAEWTRMATVVVSARVGIWSSTKLIPEGLAPASATSFRWSSSLSAVISRDIRDCPETALFRHFLSQAPSDAGNMQAACKALMWAAPPMLLAAVSRAVRDESSYASNILEGVVKRHLRESEQASSYLDLYSVPVWDAFRAAATGAYGIDRLRALASDMVYATSAQLRIAREGGAQLRQQLEDAMAEQVGCEDAKEDLSDTASVADTEAGSPIAVYARPHVTMLAVPEDDEPLTHEPPPPLDQAAHDELVSAIRKTKPMTPAWRSLARGAPAIETEIAF